MKIKNVRIKNFLTITDAEVSLDNAGLVLIQGRNEDDSSATSNGAGKSSIADALCWALYGETARGESGDSVVNDFAKSNCSVEVVIEDGASVYSVTRHRKHKTHKNATVVSVSNAGTETVISKGTEKETQELINTIMGCDKDVFCAAIYAGQEDMPNLPKMTDKQLKVMIEQSAGIEDIEAAYALARQKLLAAQNAVAARNAAVLLNEQTIDTLRAKIENAKVSLESSEREKQEKIKALEEEADAAGRQMRELLAKIKAVPLADINARVSELSAQIAGRDAALEEIAQIRLQVQQSADASQQLQNRVTALQEQIDKLKSDMENVESLVEKSCPTCGSKIEKGPEAVAHFKTHIAAKIEAASKEIDEALQKQIVRKSLREVLVKEADEKAALIPDMSDLMTEFNGLQATITHVATMKANARTLHEKVTSRTSAADSLKTTASPWVSVIESHEIEIERREREIEVGKKLLIAEKKQESIYASVVKVFGPAGIRAHLLDTVTPFLNARTSDYLSALSDGNITAVWSTLTKTAKGELKEKFSIDVAHAKGGASYGLISGGEKRKVRLATALALQDLVASRATKPIDLWVGDEIDDALDPAGLERLMVILERKARERGTVLVISHNELKDWCDNVLTVVKTGKGQSRIE